MSDPQSDSRWSLWRSIVLDNVGWILAFATLVGVVVTFILGGWLWVIIGTFLTLLILCVALVRSLVNVDARRKAAERRLAEVEKPSAAVAEYGNARPRVEAVGVIGQTEAIANERPVDGGAGGEDAKQEALPGTVPTGEIAPAEPDPQQDAFRAAFNDDPVGVVRALAPWIESAEGDERPEREALQAYLLVLAGEHAGIGELFRLADNNPGNTNIVSWLARGLDLLGEPLMAAEEISRRREQLEGPRRLWLTEARLRRRVGQADIALTLARSALDVGENDPDLRASALIEEGYALEELGRTFESFASFEQALDLAPGNTEVRFHLAFQYAQATFHHIALGHYLVLKAQGQKGMTDNNLAVEFDHFALPILAVQSFKDASNNSVALAHGNLAMRLIGAGFIDEAMAEVGQGEKLEATNRMVAHALTRMRSDREEQERKRDDLVKRGRSLREVFAQFDLRTPSDLPAGEFTSKDGLKITLSLEGQEVKGHFGEWEATAKLEQGFIHLSLKKGMFSLQSASGYGVARGNDFVGFVNDYPNKGDVTSFTAGRQPAP